MSDLNRAFGKQTPEPEEKPKHTKHREGEETKPDDIAEQILRIAAHLPPAQTFHTFAVLPFPDGSALFIGYDITNTPRSAFILDSHAVHQLAVSTRAEK